MVDYLRFINNDGVFCIIPFDKINYISLTACFDNGKEYCFLTIDTNYDNYRFLLKDYSFNKENIDKIYKLITSEKIIQTFKI